MPACWPSSTVRISRRVIPRPRRRATSTARARRSNVTCSTSPASISSTAAGTSSRSTAGSPAFNGPPVSRAVSDARVVTAPRRSSATSALTGRPTHHASTGTSKSPVTARARERASKSARTAAAPGADGTAGSTSTTLTWTGVSPTVRSSREPRRAPASPAKRAETATGTGPGAGKAVATSVLAASGGPFSATVVVILSSVPAEVGVTATAGVPS